MKEIIRPLHILPAVLAADNIIRFRSIDGKFLDCHNHQEVIWKILEFSNGRAALPDVIRRVAELFPDTNKKVIQAAAKQLLALGVLVDSNTISDIFHQYTNNPTLFPTKVSDQKVLEYTKTPRLAVKAGRAQKITHKTDNSLTALLSKRRTTRAFADKPVDLAELGHILISGYSIPRHSVPSGGALYPLKLYVIILKSTDTLHAGYYEYDPEAHELVLYNDTVNHARITYAFNDEQVLGNAPAIIVIAGDIKRNQPKYGSRGYRLMLLEAGHVAQNMQLAAAEQHLDCFEYAGFQDDAIDRLLELNKPGEARILPLVSLGIGYKSDESLSTGTSAVTGALKEVLIGDDKPFISMGVLDLKDSWMRHAAVRARPNGRNNTYAAGGTSEAAEPAILKALAEAYERQVSSHVRVDREATAVQLTSDGELWLDPRIVAPLGPEHFTEDSFMQAFHEEDRLQWTKGMTAHSKKTVWAPIDMVFYPIDAGRWKRGPLVRSSSSGVAAFTDRQTAIERGMLELLERHCLMTLWHQRTQPKVIPANLLPAQIQERIALWAKRGWQVHILDISSAFGEVTAKVIIESEHMYPHYVCGAAASFISFEEALKKALQEAETAAETILHKQPETFLKPKDVRSVSHHGEFYAHEHNAGKMAWSWQGTQALSMPEPTTTAKKLFRKLDPVVIDISPPDAPLAVVRVICEELVPIGFGFGNTHHLHRSLKDTVDPISLSLPHDFA